jgi:hypothetical protein
MPRGFCAFIGAQRRALTDDGAEGTPRQRPILRPRTNSCCCAGLPAPESVSARTRDGSRRKRTPPRSLHVLMFPPETIFAFHTTPQGMECHHLPVQSTASVAATIPASELHSIRHRLRVDHTRCADSTMVPAQQLEVAAQQPDSIGFSISR